VIHAPFNRFHIFDKDSHPLKLKIGKYLQRHGWTRGKNPRRLNGFRDPVSPPQNAFSARCSLTATKTGPGSQELGDWSEFVVATAEL
jgi:hypothetical protein